MPPWLPASPFWELAYWFNLNALLARQILGPSWGFSFKGRATVLGRVRFERFVFGQIDPGKRWAFPKVSTRYSLPRRGSHLSFNSEDGLIVARQFVPSKTVEIVGRGVIEMVHCRSKTFGRIIAPAKVQVNLGKRVLGGKERPAAEGGRSLTGVRSLLGADED